MKKLFVKNAKKGCTKLKKYSIINLIMIIFNQKREEK